MALFVEWLPVWILVVCVRIGELRCVFLFRLRLLGSQWHTRLLARAGVDLRYRDGFKRYLLAQCYLQLSSAIRVSNSFRVFELMAVRDKG